MSGVRFDGDLLAAVAARLDLREPNREAVESVARVLSQHYEVDHADTDDPPGFECVVDSATGVGKTFIMAGLIEYLAADRGVGDFAVIAPGRTILDKTIDNFTPGHPKSLLGSMEVDPLVVTADNFDRPSTRVAMEDLGRVKVYIFTVQSLLRPRSKADRRTHEFQEGLGGAFYEHLQQVSDLVVFADEHHAYYGPAFSDAVRDLTPWALVGLTATPHKNTPEDQIVYRYPLAAAIADQWVKTPVIVGRKDDRHDDATQLADGVALLRAKAQCAEGYAAEHGAEQVNPIMLVIASDIAEAEEYERLLTSEAFDGGEWAGKVLRVDSSQPDEALALLDEVEDPASPVRIIVAVGMLKEGWDVKNVYVIASLRASVSDILTEQTLGRGMRLPWGAYTGIEMLDTLEVLRHDRYEDLLERADILNESFVDYRTRAVLSRNAQGDEVVTRETTQAAPGVSTDPAVATGDAGSTAGAGTTKVTDIETRTRTAEEATGLRHTYHPRTDAPQIEVPELRMSPRPQPFSLADVTDHEPFRRLGERLAVDPEAELRRMVVSARIITGSDGLRRTELVHKTAADIIEGEVPLFPLEEARQFLADAVLASEIAPARDPERERNALQPILDEFLAGLGEDAERLLGAYRDRAAARLIRVVTDAARTAVPAPQYHDVIDTHPIGRPREATRPTTAGRFGAFSAAKAYTGYDKSLYDADWFDSAPERAVANLLDDADTITVWVRLQRNDLPILWRDDSRTYHADFVAVETDDAHWVIEVKADRDADRDEVQAKRTAARRWANHVNADPKTSGTWRYLLATETDIDDARGAWSALKALGS